MDANRAYEIGRQAGVRDAPIAAPRFDLLHSARTAEMLETHFWQGVRDVRTENRTTGDFK